jgi:hypothetical protein
MLQLKIMKKYITAFFLLHICFFSTYAQHSCKDCVYDLYKTLSTYQLDSIDIGENTYSVSSLYQGKNNRIIFEAITKARVLSYGNPLDSVVVLNLGNKALFFLVSTESPRCFKYFDINSIYDGKGHNLLYKDDYIKFPAVINDPDAFTYVREGPSKKYRVKNKILQNEIFLYTPNLNSDWYRVYSNDGNLFLGYIYRKRILPYDKCPINIKKEMMKIMFD